MQMNPVCVLSFVVRIYFRFLHRRLDLQSGLFSLGFPPETFYSFSFSPYICHMPRPLRTPFVDQPDIIWWRVQILHLSFFSILVFIIIVLISPSKARLVKGLNVDILITLKCVLKERCMWMWNELNLCVIYQVEVGNSSEHGDKPWCSLKLSDYLTSSGILTSQWLCSAEVLYEPTGNTYL